MYQNQNQNQILNMQDSLSNVFDFSAEDIAANQTGELTSAQKKIKGKHYANSRTVWLIFAMVFWLVFISLFFR